MPRLEGDDSVKADRLRQAAYFVQVGQGSIRFDTEDTDCAQLRVNGVNVFAIGGNSDIHVVAACGVDAHDRGADWRQCSVFGD